MTNSLISRRVFETAGIEGATLHSLRRSIATAMGDELGVPMDVTSAILAHSPRTRHGVTTEYDRAKRLDERREALERWADLLTGESGGATARAGG